MPRTPIDSGLLPGAITESKVRSSAAIKGDDHQARRFLPPDFFLSP